LTVRGTAGKLEDAWTTMRVLIVGAGPGGSAAAIRLARHGVDDVLLVDRATFPRDKTCGSALSPLALRTLADLGVADDVTALGYGIHSLLLKTPRGREVCVRGDQAAVILLRRDFDQLLVTRATTLGVRFRDGLQVTALLKEGGRVVGVRAGNEEIRADYVICAEGAHSRFSIDPRPQRTIATIMGWWENVAFEAGTIEMVFDRRLMPLYGWMFPESTSRVNIGITVDADRAGAALELGNLRGVFARFLDDHYRDRLTRARPVGRWCGHPISHSAWTRHSAAPGVFYIGEAARLTNAATGEGIYQALHSGLLAADAIAAVARHGVRDNDARRRYVWTCRSTFVPGLAIGHVFRGAVRIGVLDAVAAGLNNRRLRRLATWAIGSALTGSAQRAGIDAGADPVQQIK
jgi:geranylgeranyl reductase family protein